MYCLYNYVGWIIQLRGHLIYIEPYIAWSCKIMHCLYKLAAAYPVTRSSCVIPPEHSFSNCSPPLPTESCTRTRCRVMSGTGYNQPFPYGGQQGEGELGARGSFHKTAMEEERALYTTFVMRFFNSVGPFFQYHVVNVYELAKIRYTNVCRA